MYGPDLRGLVVVYWAALAVPLLLGVVATLLAGSEGAAAGPHLPAGRRMAAATAGGLAGCLALAGVAFAGLAGGRRNQALPQPRPAPCVLGLPCSLSGPGG